jgi:hypothetical protein
MQTIIPLAKTAFPGFDIVPHPPGGTEASDQQFTEVNRGLKLADRIIKTLDQVRWAFYDTLGFRHSFFNFAMKMEGNWVLPSEWIHLPAESFSKAPASAIDDKTFWRDPLICGYVIDRRDGSKHYYQSQSTFGQPVEIPEAQIFHVTDDTPGNLSILAAILPTIDFWHFCRKALGLTVQRTGAPNAIARTSLEAINVWKESYDGPIEMGLPKSVWDHLNEIVKLQGTGTAFNVPPGSELVYPPVSMPMRPTEIDQYIKRDILTHLIPNAMLDTLGNAISKSSQPALDFFIILANGWREVCAKPFETFYTSLLNDNGFTDWTVTFEWWPIIPKDVAAEHARVHASFGSGLLLINEARTQTGQPELDEAGIEQLLSQWERMHGKPQALSAFGSPPPTHEATSSPFAWGLETEASKYPTLVAADKYHKKFEQLFQGAIKDLEASLVMDLFSQAWMAGSIDLALESLAWDEFELALGEYKPLLRLVVGESGTATTKRLSKIFKPKLEFKFNLVNQATFDWLETHSAELVKELTGTSRDAIRDVLVRGHQDNIISPAKMANEIRQYIGLDERRVLAVDTKRAELRAAGWSDSAIETKIARYTEDLLRDRAQLIASNETLEAANWASYKATKDMFDSGAVSPADWEAYRIVTPDDRLCEFCSSYEGETRSLPDGIYQSTGTPIVKAHISCRCVEGVRRIQ